MSGLRWLGPLIGAVSLVCGGPLLAADGSVLFATCVACHGSKGEGNAALKAPAIAGQDVAYVTRQLQNFRSGLRGAHEADGPGAQMRAAGAASLKNDAAATAVARYVAQLPKTVPASPARGDLRNGNNLYHGKCGACHGGRAEGNPALNAPRLAGLDADYLRRQYAHFRDGIRGADARDRYGRQMAMMAMTMPAGRELDDVIAYVHAQGRAK